MGSQSIDGDGASHGFFTNGLLEAMRGMADIDHNGILDYEELHKYVLEKVQLQHSDQTPQLRPLYPAAILKAPVLGQTKPLAALAAPAIKLIIALPGPMAAFRSIVGEIPDLRIAGHPSEATVLLKGEQSQLKPNLWKHLTIERASGAVHETFHTFNSDDPEDRKQLQLVLRRLVAIQRLLSLVQASSLKLTIQFNPPGRTALFMGEDFEVQAILEGPARILLLSLAANGQIDVMWPYRPEDDRMREAGKPITIPGRIGPPLGPETYFLAALQTPPPEWEKWAGQQRTIAEPTVVDYEQLLTLFSGATGLKGFASISSYSMGRP